MPALGQGDVAINLEHVHAMFERYSNAIGFGIRDISNGRTVFTIDWGDMVAVYGAPFAALLEIIAEEEEVIIPIDASYMRQFPDQNAAQQVRQNCRTIVCTRSMPHNRAHWIMREIFGNCRWPQPPTPDPTQEIGRCIDVLFPTQERIDLMIDNHSEFVLWAESSQISDYDISVDEDLCRNYECVKNGLFPYAFGTIEASCFKVDEYFRALHHDSYHVIQTLRIQRPVNQSLELSHSIEANLMYLLPNVLRQKRIPVDRKMKHIFRVEDWHTWNCLRTFRKSWTVRHQKRLQDVLRIDREVRMCKFFLDRAVPFLCSEGIMNSDTVPNLMKYLTS